MKMPDVREVRPETLDYPLDEPVDAAVSGMEKGI